MLQSYSVINGRIAKGAEGFPQIEVYNLPDETERNHLINDYGVDEHTLLSSTAPHETPRIEFEDNHTAVFLK